METITPLLIKIPVSYIPSENQRLAGGRTKHLTPIAKQFKSEVYNSLNQIDVENFYDKYPFLDGNWSLKVSYHFVVNQSYWRRDWDNFIKMFQDTLFEWLELNDSLIVSGQATKFFAPSAPSELIVVKLEPANDIDISSYEKKFRQVSEEVPQ